MDFTSTYRHASWDCLSFSPGSTFIACVAGAARTNVLVRVSGTLQVVRNWELDCPLHALEWSKDGLFLLVSSYADTHGVSYVLPLDPDASVTDGSDDGRGWIARIEAGPQGLQNARWLSVWRIPSVLQFAPFDMRAMVYSLADQSFMAFPNALCGKVLSNAEWPEHFALVQHEEDHDHLVLYRPAGADAPTLEAPVQWSPERSIRLHTSHVQGVDWSPDGQFFAVWDHELEYKLFVYSLSGALQTTFWVPPSAEAPVSQIPHTDLESTAGASAAQRSSGGARRVMMRKSSDKEKLPERMPSVRRPQRATRSSSGAGIVSDELGIRHVAWHPSSRFLAVGAYDEAVRILASDDWSEVYVLDLSQRVVQPPAAAHLGSCVWHEPRRWFEATEGRGIVAFEPLSLPVEVPCVRGDAQNPAPAGVQTLAWNRDGTLLVCRNECMPTAVFVYAFLEISTEATEPHLTALLLFSAPVCDVAWKPCDASTLAVVTGQSSAYLWTHHKGDTTEQNTEAIAVPNDGFSAMHVQWSPDGHSLLLADQSTFCCVIAAPDAEQQQDTTAE